MSRRLGVAIVAAAVLAAAPGPAVAKGHGHAAHGGWQRYALAPTSRDVAPVRVVSAQPRGGEVRGADGVLRPGGRALELRKTTADSDPRVLLDFGREVGGYLQADFTRPGANTLFAFSESLAYMGDWGDTFGSTSFIANEDRALPQRARRFESPHEHAPAGRETWRDPDIRGGLRYVMVRLDPDAPAGSSVSLDAVRLRYSPLPGYDLHDRDALFRGTFLSSDDELNRIWYAGANTLHLGTIDPAEGIEDGKESIGVGRRVLVDGAKRDRLIWNGDLAIAGRIAYATTFDLEAVRNSLASIARTQRADGYLSGCSPNGLGGPACQTFLEYHLWWLVGLLEYHLYSGDDAFVDAQWPTITRAMDYLASRVVTTTTEGTEAQDSAPRVEPGHTLGQSFTVERPFTAAGGRFPTYNTTGSDMTLSLYRGGPGGELVTRKRFDDVVDNSWLSLEFDEPQPAGTYYLEQSDPAGTMAWWSDTQDVYPGGQAYADGRPSGGDRTLRIAVVGAQPTHLLDLGDQGNHWIYGDGGRETEVNALYVEVLRGMADLARTRGDDARADRWGAEAPEVARGINDELWSPDAGAYRESTANPGNVPQDGNVFAVLNGVATGDRAASALDFLHTALLTPYGTRTGTGTMPQLVGPFMNYWEALARFRTGRDAQAWDLLRRVWGYMHGRTKTIAGTLEPPATAAWEHINLDGTPYRAEDGSLAHPWSAGATALLTNEVLGVTPVAPGFAEWRLEPHPGDLRWAQGRVPTPHGAIRVRWMQHRGRLAVHVAVPRGTRGTVVLPRGGTRTVSAGRHLLTGGHR